MAAHGSTYHAQWIDGRWLIIQDDLAVDEEITYRLEAAAGGAVAPTAVLYGPLVGPLGGPISVYLIMAILQKMTVYLFRLTLFHLMIQAHL